MDEARMAELTKKFLSKHSTHASNKFRELIAEMSMKSVAKALLTYHPSYSMQLGIAATDKGFGATCTLATELKLVPNYDEEYDSFVEHEKIPRDERGDIDSWIDEEYAWRWIHDAWITANGEKAGLTVVLLDNGMEIYMDLNTGDTPDDSIDLSWSY